MINEDPHRRLNDLTGEWIFVSAHNSNCPWLGKFEPLSKKRDASSIHYKIKNE